MNNTICILKRYTRSTQDSYLMIAFSKKIFILGCGSIAQCSLPLILKHIDIKPSHITVMDCLDNSGRISEELKRGVRYVQQRITKNNFQEILSQHMGEGDLFIDLSFGVSSLAMIEWCHNTRCLYLNAAVELWEDDNNLLTTLSEQTLYPRQMALRQFLGSRSPSGPTAIIDHGANPGIVSHLTKQGLADLASYFLQKKPNDPRANDIRTALEKEQFPNLSYLLGVKTIHISEKDTQISNVPKDINEFVNTWSVPGFIEEGIAPAEMGWGTHEKVLPPGGMEHEDGPRNQIYLSQKGINTWVQSWVPSGPIFGMVIRHGEAFTISDYLTVQKNGNVTYRPTVHYAYRPCDEAIHSLHELEMRSFRAQNKQRILNDEIVSGQDELGCLLMGHDFGSWWIGSILDFNEASDLVPRQNATTVQVTSGILAAIVYMIKNPNQGLCQPEDLPYKKILEVAAPYLGKLISQPIDWSPMLYSKEIPESKKIPSEEDMWQFTTFQLPSQSKILPTSII